LKYYFCEFAWAARVGTGPAGSDKTPDEGWALSAADPIFTAVELREGAAVVSIGGEIDLSTAPAFDAAITEALDEDPPALVIDLSKVGFMASVGLRILAATQEKAGASTPVAVVANNAATGRPIQLTGLDRVIAVHPTLDAALAAVGRTAGD
jgi:anti-sigma B factor antagonist